MEELINIFKKKIEKMNTKDLISNLFIILIILIIFFVAMNILLGNRDEESEFIGEQRSETISYDYNTELEKKLIGILSKFKGVGQVDVMITFEDSVETIPASNTIRTVENTKETDSQGGMREVQREDTNIQIVNSQSGIPMTIKEVNPTIRGVIVVAEGASNPLVLERLYEAVKTVLGVNGNRVQVYSSY